MDIFEFDRYRDYINKRLEAAPKKGHGQALKLARALEISTTLMSQILNGQRQMTLEQASLLCEHFGLTPLETEYFLVLVQLERAGNPQLRKILLRQKDRLKEEAKKVINRLIVSSLIPDEDKAIFYSEWYYSAIRQMTAIPGYNTADAIARELKLPVKVVHNVLNFLVRSGLCVEVDGQFKIGPNKTHVDADSPFVKMHHTNWRHKALELLKFPDDQKLHYSSPVTLSRNDSKKVRAKLLAMIEEVGKIVDPSPSEELMCLNVDWFSVRTR